MLFVYESSRNCGLHATCSYYFDWNAVSNNRTRDLRIETWAQERELKPKYKYKFLEINVHVHYVQTLQVRMCKCQVPSTMHQTNLANKSCIECSILMQFFLALFTLQMTARCNTFEPIIYNLLPKPIKPLTTFGNAKLNKMLGWYEKTKIELWNPRSFMC